MNKKKWKINWKTVGRNAFIVLNVILIISIIHTIKTEGISFFSTIGYFD